MATITQNVTFIGNRYQVLEKLGVGGMGTVYSATDRLTGQRVALKQIALEQDRLQIDSTSLGSVDFRLALAEEFRILASLRHPHVINVLNYGFDSAKQPYFTMTLLENPQDIVTYGRSQAFEIQI